MHIKADNLLPIAASSTSEAELFMKTLRQMVENERIRARNEFLRIIFSFFIILILLLCAGFWFSHDILQIAGSYRGISEQPRSEPAIHPPSHVVDRLAAAPIQPETEASLPKEAPAAMYTVEPEPKPESEPEALYGNTLTISTHGNIPLRAPIPKP